MEQDQILHMDVTTAHRFAVGELPLHHRDPFDRQLRLYPVDLLW